MAGVGDDDDVDEYWSSVLFSAEAGAVVAMAVTGVIQMEVENGVVRGCVGVGRRA